VRLVPRLDHGAGGLGRGQGSEQEASRELGTQMLVPKGQQFADAPAKIYALVQHNPDRKPVSEFMPSAYDEWRDRAKDVNDATMRQLPDLPRAGGQANFERHQFQAPGLAEQGYELTAVTADSDRDGNAFIVAIVLSADTREAFATAMPAYTAVLQKY